MTLEDLEQVHKSYRPLLWWFFFFFWQFGAKIYFKNSLFWFQRRKSVIWVNFAFNNAKNKGEKIVKLASIKSQKTLLPLPGKLHSNPIHLSVSCHPFLSSIPFNLLTISSERWRQDCVMEGELEDYGSLCWLLVCFGISSDSEISVVSKAWPMSLSHWPFVSEDLWMLTWINY